MKRNGCGPVLALAILACGSFASAEEVEIATLKELAEYGGRSGNRVTMKAGVYKMVDLIPISALPERRRQNHWTYLTFDGHDNVFTLTGVTIEFDTAMRSALRPPIHTDEILVNGNNNVLEGLTIRHIGDGVSLGGAAIGITGQSNTLRDCSLHVRGSYPYGYGDLFGKGGPNIIGPQKKSGVHITGHGSTLIGCKLYMRSFGHGYFIQEDAENVRFENCYVEGVMRATDEMLAETTGPAAKVGFRTVLNNRRGDHQIMPGYTKSLSEDGFRTYGQHKNLSFKNCTAKNMRAGFELRSKSGARLENCVAIGNERGFWISTTGVMQNCRGDAQFGPLLFVEGENVSVDVELLPTETQSTVHALATIQGRGNNVTITQAPDAVSSTSLPILVGYGPPMMGDGMAPFPERDARDVVLRNDTAMPVVIGAKSRDCEIVTQGPIQENNGVDIRVRSINN